MNNRRLLLNLNDEDMKKIPMILYGSNIYCDDVSYAEDLFTYIRNNTSASGAQGAAAVKLLQYYDIILRDSSYNSEIYIPGNVIMYTNGSNNVISIKYVYDIAADTEEINYSYYTLSNSNVLPYTGSVYDIS